MQGYMYKTLKSIFIAGLLVSLSTQLPLAAMQQEIQQQKKVEKKQQNNSGSIFTLENLLRAGAITGVVIGVAAIWYFSSNNGNGSDTSNNKNNVRISNITTNGRIEITDNKVFINGKDYSSLVQNNKNCDISITNIGGNETVTINGKDYSPLPQKFSSKETLNEEGAGLSKIVVQNTRGKVMVKRDTTLKDVVIDIEKKATKEEDLKSLIVATKKEFSTTEKKDGTLSIISTWNTKVIQNACINYLIRVPENIQDSKVTTNGGKIIVSDLPGNHDLTGSCGGIEVNNGGNVSCKEISGDICLNKVKKVDFNVSSGKTVIKNAEDVTGASSSGDMKFNNVKNVTFKTSSGKTEVEKAKNINGTSSSGDMWFKNVQNVTFKTSSGNTKCEDARNISGEATSGDGTFSNVGTIEFDRSSGKATINKAGPTLVSSTSGDTIADNIKGDFEGSSSSGDFTLQDVVATTWKIKTTSADISLKNVTGNGLATSTSGDMSFDNCSGANKANTTSGDITIKSSPKTTGTTRTGDIKRKK